MSPNQEEADEQPPAPDNSSTQDLDGAARVQTEQTSSGGFPQNPTFHDSHSTAENNVSASPTDENSSQNATDRHQNRSPKGDQEDGSILASDVALPFLASARDQVDLERDIDREADELIASQALKREEKRLQKAEANLSRAVDQLKSLQERLDRPGTVSAKAKIRSDIEAVESRICDHEVEIRQIRGRMDEVHWRLDPESEVQSNQRGVGQTGTSSAGEQTGRQPYETERQFLIRTGKITPFAAIDTENTAVNSLSEVIQEAEEATVMGELSKPFEDAVAAPVSHQNLLRPGFGGSGKLKRKPGSGEKTKRKREGRGKFENNETSASGSSDSEYVLSDEEHVDRSETGGGRTRKKVKIEGAQERRNDEDEEEEEAQDEELQDEEEAMPGTIDDGNEKNYQRRLSEWIVDRSEVRRIAELEKRKDANGETHTSDEPESDHGLPEWTRPHPTIPDAHLAGGLRLPGDIHPSLFDYQRIGVQWLWELYCQNTGGILGDEMGLGKTIQLIAFIASLHYSGKLTGPVIVVTPATVMRQWVAEFHRWWPPLRVCILHASGNGMGGSNIGVESEDEDDILDDVPAASAAKLQPARKIVNRVLSQGHVLVTTYAGLQTYARALLPVQWAYAALDEGHKIRNPDADMTVNCKRLQTAHRLILSGTPMQNNLAELWSLFDFACPMRLGTLVKFRDQFEIPIRLGGYANASNLQVETAALCASELKAAIGPHLLQRTKSDVAKDLPEKLEKVLFCHLTPQQKAKYTAFLSSREMEAVLEGRRQSLFGIDILRKICNHPDLVDHKILSVREGYPYGETSKSGKLTVLKALISSWSQTGHKTLLFAQQRITLDLLERFIKSELPFVEYLRMDGTTAVAGRHKLVDQFNGTDRITLFLLTTKVGGLGLNLTSADRVVIVDPDWNPSTDMQARERAWRLGQKRKVEIYRLMTAGTIEEKIYKRQLFKHYLSAKVLKDPSRRAAFEKDSLRELFQFGDGNAAEEGNQRKGRATQGGASTRTSGRGRGRGGHRIEARPCRGTSDSGNNRDGEHSDGLSGLNLPYDDPQPDLVVKKEPSPAAARSNNDLLAIEGIARHENFGAEDDTRPSSSSTSGVAAAQGLNGSASSNPLLTALFSRPNRSHSDNEAGNSSSGNNTSHATGSRAKAKRVEADPKVLAAVAQEIADAAAAELRRNAQEAARVVPGTVTWTGVVGTAGRPAGHFRNRDESRGAGGGGARTGNTGPGQQIDFPPNAYPTPPQLMSMIRQFFLANDGVVYSQMLMTHFNRFCNTRERATQFRELLRRLAVLEKPTEMSTDSRSGQVAVGDGASRRSVAPTRPKWILKNEWRRR